MDIDYEACRGSLEELANYYRENRDTRNEATTRLQLIDKLFIECLGWSRDDIISEESQNNQYADYTFKAPRRMLIVEAKKEGDYFELPEGYNREEYALSTLLREYPELKKAIEQVCQYCQTRGVPYAAVCNGHQIVTFVATRDDGISPFEGKALVFPSIDVMQEKFLKLWQALSKPAVESKRLSRQLTGGMSSELPPKLSKSIYQYPGTKQRNEFQTDLQIVSELVIEDIVRSRDLEVKFLEACYCPSGALSQHSLISKNILQTRYEALFSSEPNSPITLPSSSRDGISSELLAESLSRRPIILLGDVGAGKTTFIRHFIKIDAEEQFDTAISIYVDLGSKGSLTADIKSFIYDDIKKQLLETYGVDIEEGRFVRGVYHSELQRFGKGIYADIKETNPTLFKEREVVFLSEKLSKREEHLRCSVEHVSKARKKQIVVFLDNADQRNDDIQQDVFLISQEVALQWSATVFVALRPETFARSMKEGTLSGYHKKAFTIAPPRIDRVVTKRLEFAKRLASGELPISLLPESTRVNINKLNTIIDVFLGTIGRRDEIIELIDNISKGNVRLALDMVKDFFGSGHVNTPKIIDIFSHEGDYLIPLHEFLRAVIYDDTMHYNSDRTTITNIFDVFTNDPKEHFLIPILISYLESSRGRSVGAGYVETTIIYEALQSLGFTPTQIDEVIIQSERRDMIETTERKTPRIDENMPEALRPTSVGVYHVRKLCRLFTYIDAIIVDTPVFEREAREAIRDVQDIESRLERACVFKDYLTRVWSQEEERLSFFDWQGTVIDLETDIRRIKERVARDKL